LSEATHSPQSDPLRNMATVPDIGAAPDEIPGSPAIPASRADAASALILGTVPLGGAGTGCVEVSADCRLRHLSINNNRSPESWIPASPNTFLAVRVAYLGEAPHCYILQRDSRSQNTDVVPVPRIPKDAFSSRGIFPMLHFFARSNDLPFSAVWMLYAPVIPFDVEASVLPMLLSSVVMRNRAKQPASVSVLFHMEHMAGRTGDDPLVPRPVSARHVEEEDAPPPPKGEETTPLYNALIFESGLQGAKRRDCDGQHCIAVRARGMGEVSVGAYVASIDDRCFDFWQHFMTHGDVPTGSVGSNAEYGAVCLRFNLAPKEERRVDFLWSWFCPDFHAHDGERMGNGYTCVVNDVLECIRRGLKHGRYYHDAVLDWQQRLHSSTLPRWLVKELINSARVFTRNGLYGDDGRFGLQASPLDKRVGDVASRLYPSFGTLLFLPRFEEEELTLACRARDPLHPAFLCHSLGVASLHHPQAAANEAEQMELAANLVISAYRNYLLTGSLVHARKRFPMLRELMHQVIALDYDGDGYPEGGGDHAAKRLCAAPCGLWLLALRCYALLAHERQSPDEADLAEALFTQARISFEDYFWSESAQSYLLWRPGHEPDDESATQMRHHLGQLAGEWQANLLNLAPLHMSDRISKTLHAMTAKLDDDINNLSPNVFADPDALNRIMGHTGSLLVYRDRVKVGLRLVERMLSNCERVHGAARRQRTSSLTVWHVLQAIHGVTLDMSRQQLRVMPHLPPEVAYLSTPVITPSGLCWLKFRVETSGTYRQQFHISFDSPTNIASILLRVPVTTNKVKVICEVTDGKLPCKVDVLPGEYYRIVLVTLDRAIYAGSAFSLDLQAIQ